MAVRSSSSLAAAILVVAAALSGCSSQTRAATIAATVAPSLTPASPSASPSFEVCTVEGTRKGDALVGTSGDDVICGFGGDDIIRGLGGADVLRGGPGDDRLAPGDGADALDGGSGHDVADYSASSVGLEVNLRLGTVAAEDTDQLTNVEGLVGSAKADAITGSADPDDIDGGSGNDVIRALGGDDELRGGDGNDKLLGGDGKDACLQGPGSGEAACERAWSPVAFARAGHVTLMVPAQDPLLVAYHESLFDTAAAMKPLGDGWMIQPSRGRPTPPTSAVDIALKAGTPVVSPVDGKVVDVIDYSLYCEAPDTLVVIRPDDDRTVTVEVMHLVNLKVRKGDAVYAGGTVIGEPHVFSGGTAQVDLFLPGSPPHVHVEVESDGSEAVPDCDYPRKPSK